MKWNGTVSQCEKITIAARLATEKTAHAASTLATGPWNRGQRSPGGRCGQRMYRGRSQPWAACRRGWPSGCEPISLTAHCLDQFEAQLGPQPADAHVHDVRARVEVVAPDRGEQLTLAHRPARVLHQFAQQQEFQPGQRDRP